MKTKRDIKELLELIRDYMLNNETKYGICNVIDEASYSKSMTSNEIRRIRNYLKQQKPSIENHSEFFDALYISRFYWWPPMKSGREYKQVRIEFLDKLIEKL